MLDHLASRRVWEELHDREWPVRVFEANEVVQQLSLVGWVLLRRGVNCGEVQKAVVVEAGVVLPLVRLSGWSGRWSKEVTSGRLSKEFGLWCKPKRFFF